MKQIKPLAFRRQFLLTPVKCDRLYFWQNETVNSYNLYVHPDTPVTSLRTQKANLFLIGHAINPHVPDSSTSDILKDLSKFESNKDIPSFLYPLVGRFVLIVHFGGKFFIYHDASGLKSVYYYKLGEQFFAASQPSLLRLVTNLTKSKNYEEYYTSYYVEIDREHWLPSRVTLYEDVYHLTPNHFVDSASGSQIRYWPLQKRKERTLPEAVAEMSYLLKNTMIAANKRFPLAVALTAGLDSRTVLSSTYGIIDSVMVYTLKYRGLTERSNDLKIPRSMSSKLGFSYKVFDCTSRKADKDFRDLYESNADISHFHDWGEIASGMFHQYPQDYVAVRGNCAEIGRCCLYRQGFHPKIKNIGQFLALSPGWNKISFIRDELERWLDEAMDINVVYDYDIFDLFYWEHRMGSWQAQSQLEWDIIQEAFSPFNNRELIECMLAVDTKYRREPDYLLFKKTIQTLWKDVLVEPVNPKTNYGKLKEHAKYVFAHMGLLSTVKSLNGFLMNF